MNWSSQYHNLLWVFLILCAGSFWLLPASSEEAQNEIVEQEAMIISAKGELKHGRYESKDSNGKLKSVVNYVHGQKQGTSYLYYPNGKVHLEMTYDRNLRQGMSKKYYKTGELYAATPYVNNKIEGIRETYFESGNIRATVPYHNSWPGTGLREFSNLGTERTINQGIEIIREGNVWHFQALEPCRKQVFYLGNLVDGKFFDKRAVSPLPSDGEGAILDISKYNNGSRLRGLEVICKCTTLQNNPLILSKSL